MIWGALVGGFLGTVVLTTTLRAAGELGLTRMDLPFLLGTALSADRVRAKVVGYALHFVFGLLFALGYYAVFAVIDRSGIVLGALLGLIHALFAGTALVNIILPSTRVWAPALTPPAQPRCSSRRGSCWLTTVARHRWRRSSRTSPTARSSAASPPWPGSG